MDLLAGYGSDDSNASDRIADAQQQRQPDESAPAAEPQSMFAQLPPPQAADDSGAPGSSDSVAKTSSKPGDSFAGSNFDIFLTGPDCKRPAAKKVVQLESLKKLQDALKEQPEEDEQPKKKMKPSTKGLGFLDSLPKPKHDTGMSSSGGGGAFGGGTEAGRSDALGNGQPAQPASFQQPPAAAQSSAAAAPAAQQYSNDAFRVSQQEAAAAADYGPARPPADGYANYGSYGYPEYGAAQTAQQPAGYAAAAPAQDGNVMLAQALAQESGRGDGGGSAADPFAGMNVQFKEVKQAKLTYVDPAAKAAMKGKRSALGKDYEMQLRHEADKVEPDKLSKRKHQISSLYHASKMKELEMLADHGQTLKTKAETQAKYGW